MVLRLLSDGRTIESLESNRSNMRRIQRARLMWWFEMEMVVACHCLDFLLPARGDAQYGGVATLSETSPEFTSERQANSNFTLLEFVNSRTFVFFLQHGFLLFLIMF